MKKLNIYWYQVVIIIGFFLSGNLLCQSATNIPKATEKKSVLDELVVPKDIPLFDFNFTNEDLSNIIDIIADRLHVNIILPQGNDEIKQKITFKPQINPLTFKEAVQLLETFLDLSGYTLIPKAERVYSVIKLKEKYKIGEGLPLYINVQPDDLPFTESPIRAVFYLSNLKVPSDSIRNMLNDILTSDKSAIFDPQTNGIILTDKANLIATAMKILLELDSMGTRNEVVVVQLYNSNATELVEMIKKQIIGITENIPSFLFNEAKTESAVLFPKSLRLAAEPRTNSIILMGKQSAVERMQDFIQDVLDAPLGTGDSVLHYYDLQYVSAVDLEGPLNALFATAPGAQSTGQNIAETFRGVKIIAERPIEQRSEGDQAVGGVYRGGNRLLIAARREDWLRIKALIAELDKPQEQVILEVLIVDLRLFDRRALGTTLRSTINSRFGEQGTYQLSNLSPVLEPSPIVNPPGLETNLLAPFFNNGNNSIAALLSSNDPGSLIISINDLNPLGPNNTIGGVWGLIQILQRSTIAKVLSHPFLVTTNNRTAAIDIEDVRRDVGEPNLVGSGGAINLPQVDVTAKLNVKITPRTSSSERVNLTLQINIEEFTTGNPANLTKVSRVIDTTANISTGEVLVLGGLFRDRSAEAEFDTPLLSKIPILGYFFKNKQKTANKDNLAVFIVPTIIEPRIRDGLHRYTDAKMDETEADLNDGIDCDDVRDPITRFFFKPRTYNRKTFEEYLEDSDRRKVTRIEKQKTTKSKKVKSLEINPPQEESFERLQAVVAQEDNPLLRVKNGKC